MRTIRNQNSKFCDGISRRSFLQIGSLAVGGLTLPQLLRAEEQSGKGRSNKSVIMVYLSGGISHQDTFDLKMSAPDGIRGEFQPVASNVPGIDVCELLPLTAQVMDKVAVIRSVVGLRDEHSSFQNVTGYRQRDALREGRPNFGSVIAQLNGQADKTTPAYVDLFPTMQHRPYNIPGPGVLGPKYQGTRADGEQLASMELRYVTPAQLGNRRQLLELLNRDRRLASDNAIAAMDSNYAQAFDVLTSSKLVEALDVEREPLPLRERYGKGSPTHLGDGAPMWNDQLLAARRLVETGVRCVTVAYGFWDTHGNNFGHLRSHLPLFDKGVSALVQDIYDRGLDRDVTVIVWGEFGRTPKINKDAGRDHWPLVGNALISGGGLRVGQVIGETDKVGAEALDRPVHYRDVMATLYHTLGIPPDERITDVSGRRVEFLPPDVRLIDELI
jgi:hypothetical protein